MKTANALLMSLLVGGISMGAIGADQVCLTDKSEEELIAGLMSTTNSWLVDADAFRAAIFTNVHDLACRGSTSASNAVLSWSRAMLELPLPSSTNTSEWGRWTLIKAKTLRRCVLANQGIAGTNIWLGVADFVGDASSRCTNLTMNSWALEMKRVAEEHPEMSFADRRKYGYAIQDRQKIHRQVGHGFLRECLVDDVGCRYLLQFPPDVRFGLGSNLIERARLDNSEAAKIRETICH